jgi:hypothetical protein
VPSPGGAKPFPFPPPFSIAGVFSVDFLENAVCGVAGFGGSLKVRTRGRGAAGSAQRGAALKLCDGGDKDACADVKKDE